MKALLGGLALLCLSSATWAADIPYQFVPLDVSVSGRLFGLADINDDGSFLINAANDDLTLFRSVVVVDPKGRKKLPVATTFTCNQFPGPNYIETNAINNFGYSTGLCSPLTPDPNGKFGLGFVRDKHGNQQTLDVPGSVATWPLGISNHGHGPVVVGFYWNAPGDFHCFFYDGISNYYTLDFPGASATYCDGITTSGWIVGEFIIDDPVTNELIENGWFVYYNGQYYVIQSSLATTNPTRFRDINDLGQIIGANFNTNTLVLYDDGIFYNVPLPGGWFLNTLGGLNNDGRFVGTAWELIGIQPDCDSEFDDCGIYDLVAFVARPAPPPLALDRGRK